MQLSSAFLQVLPRDRMIVVSPVIFTSHVGEARRPRRIKRITGGQQRSLDVVVPSSSSSSRRYYAKGRRISPAAKRRVARPYGIHGEMCPPEAACSYSAPFDTGRERWCSMVCVLRVTRVNPARPVLSPTSSWNSVSLIRPLAIVDTLSTNPPAPACAIDFNMCRRPRDRAASWLRGFGWIMQVTLLRDILSSYRHWKRV